MPTRYKTSKIAVPSGRRKWEHGVLHANGKIYMLPQAAESVLIIDPTNPSKVTTDLTTLAGLKGDFKWEGAVIAPNGNIYGIPNQIDQVRVIKAHL